MPPKRTFDAELVTLEALRNVLPEAAEPELAKAFNLRNNLLVAKAAAVTLHHRLTGLTPNLAAAFRRFLGNSAKSDPQCWAKNALAKTLAAFEYQEAELFLIGMRHIQLEPVWGRLGRHCGNAPRHLRPRPRPVPRTQQPSGPHPSDTALL
jgi:hypothetical protein